MDRPFIHDDFVLYNETACRLYHDHAESMPVIDYHNHLDPQEICEDRMYENMTEIWLSSDHYKWRAMRERGIPESLITGDGAPYEKFASYAEAIQNCFGNPLYHWTHLELKRYFDIDDMLCPENAGKIWDICSRKLKSPSFSAQSLLRRQNVQILCTTDDPADSLKWHKKIHQTVNDIRVCPTFRPGNALDIEKKEYPRYMERLGRAADMKISGIEDLTEALKRRLEYFVTQDCHAADHSLERDFYRPASEAEADRILKKRLAGECVMEDEAAAYRGFLLVCLGRMYADRDLVMQLHIGAQRNNSTRMLHRVGADAGFDGISDFNYSGQLGSLLDAMDLTDQLPRTILYCLNLNDMPMLAAMAGCFQANEQGIRSKVQLGSAWWFCDHMHGIGEQIRILAETGLLSGSVGMLTDSRSILSFPRHEYYRRILCSRIGELVEKGLYPADMDYLGKMVEDICCGNALRYFRFL